MLQNQAPKEDIVEEPLETEKEETEIPEEYNDTLKEFGQTQTPLTKKKNPRGNIYCLTIIGQIEGHMALPPQTKATKYEHILPQLAAIRDNDEIDGLLILLNTVGGDIEAGLAIAEMIAYLGKPSVSLVLGGGHSIGVPLAVSTNYSFIVPTATMTIHPVRMSGLVIGVAQTFDYFEKMQDRIVEFVVRNSKISARRFKELMLDTGKLAKDVGTIIIGEEAVREGLIDETGGLDQAIEKLYSFIKEKREQKKQNQEQT